VAGAALAGPVTTRLGSACGFLALELDGRRGGGRCARHRRGRADDGVDRREGVLLAALLLLVGPLSRSRELPERA
jgi:hypothetical protein